jgi:two-component system nitrate/nitrite response regulator NarL
MIDVVLADDHPVYRDGLAHAIELRAELHLVAAASDGHQALAAIRSHTPQVAVLDLHLPGISGLAVLEAIAREQLPVRALVVSAVEDSATVYKALAAGARGYVPKIVSSAEICDAIAAVARGRTVVRPEIQDGLVDEIRLRRDRGDDPLLTAREVQILRLAADGFSNAEIGNELHLSTATVKTHMQHAFEKLEVSDRAAAVAKAIRRGLVA